MNLVPATVSAPLPPPASLEPAIRVTDEARFDAPARERLLDAAFGPDRFAKTSERLRAGRAPARGLALVAREGGEIVGTVRLWRVRAGHRPLLLLGPLAVAESHRSLGLGAALMAEAIARAGAQGHGAITLVGDEPYYRRFGFRAGLTRRLDMPGPVDRARFLALELRPGWLAGAAGRLAPCGERLRKGGPGADIRLTA